MKSINTIKRASQALSSVFFSAAVLGFSSPTLAGMIDKEGMAPWEICALCHNLNGISFMAKFPKLAGQKAEYIKKQFWDFHDERRQNDGGQMQAITTEVEMGQIDAIANYFAGLDAPKVETVADEQQADYAAGKSLFLKGKKGTPACVDCHGNSNSPAPWLYGQHADYLAKQLTDFKAGDRNNDANGVMQGIASSLEESDINALSVFLSHYQPR